METSTHLEEEKRMVRAALESVCRRASTTHHSACHALPLRDAAELLEKALGALTWTRCNNHPARGDAD